MKLLCTGDFHLGAGADYGPRPGDRLRDQEAVLDRIVAVAREENVAAVLFAGDAFERRSPTPPELMVWRRFVTALRDEAIPLLCISGNHDVASADLPSAMEVVGACGRTPEIAPLGDGMGLATLPWTPPARLVAAEGGGDRDAIHERAAELLLETARGLRAEIDGPAILLAHWSVTGASTPTGIPTEQFREPVIDVNALASLGFDFIVLGHVHEPQLLGGEEQEGAIFYVGSPAPCNYGEAESEHGVFIIDTEAHFASFHPIESRPFVTVSVDLTEPIPSLERPVLHENVPESEVASKAVMRYEDLRLDETDAIAAAIATHLPLTDAVVRIRYRATAEQARRVDLGAIRQLVADAGASKLFAVQPDIVRSDRARVEGVDESLDEREAVRIWLDRAEVARSQREPFEELFIRYLDEVRS